MRKGEKLIDYLTKMFPVLDRYEVQGRDARLITLIRNMTDEQFNKIIYGENYIEGFEVGKEF